ncbi:hypothetical protein JCM10908_002555 [Rhodotorula pacifica]|uniref:uncharacterized protein n=1 Tax=Rhodotorula pacifica TaxID=1495444 RepID=UPI00316F8CCB
MDASSRAQATSGVTALAQLPLVSFLSASPSPSLVLALAPLVECLAEQPGLGTLRSAYAAHGQAAFLQASPLPAVQTPLWDGKLAQHLPPPTPLTPLHQQQPRFTVNGELDECMSPAEGLRGMVEQLNVKTPVGGDVPAASTSTATGPSSAPTDYFSLASATAAPSLPANVAELASRDEAGTAVPSPSMSATSTASSSAATLASSSSATTTRTGKTTPPTPAEGDDVLAQFGNGAVGNDDDEDAAETLDRFADALHPVYRNEAWRSIENYRPKRPGPGLREGSTSTLKAYQPSPQHSRTEVRRNRERASSHRSHGNRGKSHTTGASSLRQPTAEEDLLLDSLPAAPGFENKPKRLGTVEEEVYREEEGSGTDEGGRYMDMEDDDSMRYPSATPSEVGTEVEPDSDAYRFLSPAEQHQLLLFLLDLVIDSDVLAESGTITPDLRSPKASPRFADRQGSTYSPRQSSFRQDDLSRRGSASTNASATVKKPVQNCVLGDFKFTATLILTPPAAPIPGTPAMDRPPPSGFVILTTPPPEPRSKAPLDPGLPQAWPPGTGIGHVPRATAVPLSPDSANAVPLAASADSGGHVFEAPSAESSRTLPRARRGSRANSGTETDLDDDQKWIHALGDGEMAQRIRAHDWSKTSLGPISGWCAELRSGVASILASPFRECILWGEDMAIVYNDLYISTAGDKHPSLLGLPAREGWKEIWDGLNSVAQRTLAGETCYFKDHFLAMERLGFVEETYHTFSYAPFRSSSGKVLGILNLSIESTATVIAARRLATVRDLVQTTSLARTVEDFAGTALRSLGQNPFDLPFVILYTVEEVTTKPTKREVRAGFQSSARKTVKLSCRGATGVPEDHPFLVQEATVDIAPPMSRQSSSSASASTGTGSTATAMDFHGLIGSSSAASNSSNASTAGPFVANEEEEVGQAWSWPFEEACLKRDPVLVEDLGSLSDTLDRSKGWSYAPRQAVVIPIMVEAGQTVPSAVLVLGVNAMSRYDHLLETFNNLIARHVAIGLFAVLAAEQDRARADELVKLDRAKSNFFSSVSHELRTPLTLILGPLEDLLTGPEKDKLNKQQREKLAIVNRHANRLLSMVNKLLDFSSIEGGRMNFKYRPVKIGPLARDIATLFRDAIERTNIEYIVDCDDDPPDSLPVYLSPDLLEKVIFNLVGNAFKYSTSGTISVRLRSTRAEAVLSVSDTGIGIPETELSKVFDRFHRVEASRMATGTGIGLALTLELVKMVGGQLEVESEVGKGSTFTVRLQRGHTHLPIDQVDHTPEEDAIASQFQSRNLSVVDEAASWRYDVGSDSVMVDTGPSPSETASMSSVAEVSDPGTSSGSGTGDEYVNGAELLSLKNRTLVLVDDSRDLRTYMSNLLSKQFQVVEFGDPREALEYINRNPPSLVVTDAMMPHISGQQLTSTLRRNPQTALIPIIMVSAQAGSEARAEALEGGVDDYLVKPFQARELLARTRVHCQLGLMRTELERRVEERTRALIESEGRNRALAERYSMLSTVSPVGVIEINTSGEIVYANPRWYTITGLGERPLSAWLDCVEPEDVPKIENIWRLAVAGGESSEASDRQFRFKNGRVAQLEIRSSSEVGLPDGYVGALTDITRQKEIEVLHLREVERRAADAEENRRNTELFLDMSSHELRNPLSGVWQNAEVVAASLGKYVNMLEELRRGQQLDDQTLQSLHDEMVENVDAVESIILCASHQGRIADDILNVSKLNMGLLTVNPVPFDLVARMNEVVRVSEAECLQKGIDLKLEADESIHRLRAEWIRADPSRLHQILLNFVSNALKFTLDSNERRVTVRITAHETQPPLRPQAMRVSQPPPNVLHDSVWVTIAVEDTGRGLSEEELKRLFARFSQANPRSDQYGGSGLGLYVSKKLVELHSGFIEVESQAGVGSIFSVTIPTERATPADEQQQPPPPPITIPTARIPKRPHSASPSSEPPKASKTSKTGVSTSPLATVPVEHPIHVLVVEDNEINRKVLNRQLKNAGYEVSLVGDGQQALDALAEDARRATQDAAYNGIQVVLMDIEMPVMDGLTAIRELRRREQAGEIDRRYPVCAVTGNARDAQQTECLAAGFNDTCTKPYKFTDIVNKITNLVPPPAMVFTPT